MTQICRPAKCIEAIRVTLLDQCTLEPVPGPMNGYAMGCIIDPDWSPEIEEGEESVVKDNCGDICLRDDRCDLTKRWNLEFKIKDPDKEFLALVEGNPLIVEAGISIGVRQLSYGNCSPFVFVEMWERTDDCSGDAVYYRHIFPAVRLKWTGNEREGVFRILQLEGKTRDVVTDSIGTGPYGDIPVGLLVGTTPSERIDYTWFEEVDNLPAIQCGAIEVPEPPDVERIGYYATTTGGGGGFVGQSVAADSNGNYFVTSSDAGPNAQIWKFLPNGTPDATWGVAGLLDVPGGAGHNAVGIAIDQATDDIYVTTYDASANVFKLDSTGAAVGAFGVAGKLTFPDVNGVCVNDAILFDPTPGEVVVAVRTNLNTGQLYRVNMVTGAIVNSTALAEMPLAMAQDTAGNYYVFLLDNTTFNDFHLAAAVPGGAPTEVAVPPGLFTYGNGFAGIAWDPAGFVYAVGTFTSGQDVSIAKFDDTTLLIDAGYGAGGSVQFTDFGNWAQAYGSDVHVLAGGDTLILGGFIDIAAPTDWGILTARLDSAGVLDAGYGAAGFETYYIESSPTQAFGADTLVEEADGRAVHCGPWTPGGAQTAFIARTLLPDGALDTTFGQT